MNELDKKELEYIIKTSKKVFGILLIFIIVFVILSFLIIN
jgi:hypothetical protein